MPSVIEFYLRVTVVWKINHRYIFLFLPVEKKHKIGGPRKFQNLMDLIEFEIGGVICDP